LEVFCVFALVTWWQAGARRSPLRRLGLAAARVLCVVAVVCAAVLADPVPAWAAATIPQVITNLTNTIVGLLAGLATLFLTFGGLRYLMAGGDPGEVESAKRALKAAAIGYGLAILAPVLVTVLKTIVGAE
jgi:hypothetical protein